MKKIITAAAIAAMVASFAAADVKVGLNNRVRPDLYKIEGITSNDAKNKDAYTKTTYADLDGFAGAQDTLSVKGSSDYAGVSAEITLKNPGVKNSKDGGFAIDNYYGWVNWGALKFTAGTYDSRYTNRGNYTATEQGILDEEFSKTMGLSTKSGLAVKGAGWLGDFGNVAQVNGGNNLSFLVDYTFNDIGGGSLLLKGGLVENGTSTDDELTYTYVQAKDGKTKTTTDMSKIEEDDTIISIGYGSSEISYDDTSDSVKEDDDKFIQAAGYVFEAAWRKEGAVAVDFIFKNPVNKAYGFGLYVTPLMIPNTKNVVIGFTYGTQEDVTKSAFAIDFRGQYNINSAATVALGAKYESYEADVDGADAETAMQVAGEFSYKVNDLFTAALDLGYFNADLDNNDDDDDDGSQTFVTSLRGKFTAGKNAAITTALRLNKVLNPADGKTDYTFDIPVVLRVKM